MIFTVGHDPQSWERICSVLALADSGEDVRVTSVLDGDNTDSVETINSEA